MQSDTSAQKVATAMIGTGNRGSFLLQAVLHQPNAKVVALCDLKPDRLDKAATAAARDNPATYTDWHRIIDRKDIDAVFIATPPYLHSEMAIAALRAGKNVYCEKPIGVTPAQVRAILEAAKGLEKGLRRRPAVALHEACTRTWSARFAKAPSATSSWSKPSATPPPTCPTTDPPATGISTSPSPAATSSSSPCTISICATGSIGAHPTRACGFGAIQLYKNDPPGRTIFDCGSLTYDYPGGVKMSFTQNVFHPASMPNGNQYVYVYGSKGAIDLMAGTMYPPRKTPSPSRWSPKQQEDQYAHMAAFYASITQGAPPPVDIKIGAAAALTAILGTPGHDPGKGSHLERSRRRRLGSRDWGLGIGDWSRGAPREGPMRAVLGWFMGPRDRADGFLPARACPPLVPNPQSPIPFPDILPP